MKQILLKGPGFSGRGVRLQELTPDQVDQIREESARAMSADEDESPAAKQQVWVSAQKKAGVAAMVVAVTKRTGFKKSDELLPKEIEWTKPTVDELTASPEKYFNTKDLDALGDIYFRMHVAVKAEVDDILGEALEVTAD